jgi:hypothetical protein
MSGATRVTGRALRRALRERFGVAGKTSRVFQIWRQEVMEKSPVPLPDLPADTLELQRRLMVAEALAAQAIKRAELAEYREEAHQVHWALEIDRLREELRSRPKLHADLRTAQEQVLRLSAELQAARVLLAQDQ